MIMDFRVKTRLLTQINPEWFFSMTDNLKVINIYLKNQDNSRPVRQVGRIKNDVEYFV
jgi:hypothetical protein